MLLTRPSSSCRPLTGGDWVQNQPRITKTVEGEGVFAERLASQEAVKYWQVRSGR